MAGLMGGATGDPVTALRDAIDRALGAGPGSGDGVPGPQACNAGIRFEEPAEPDPGAVSVADALASPCLRARDAVRRPGDPAADGAAPEGQEQRLRRVREAFEAASGVCEAACRGLAGIMRRIGEHQDRAAAAMREAREAGAALAALARALDARRTAGDAAGEARLHAKARLLSRTARVSLARARSEQAGAAALFEAADRLIEALERLRSG